MSAEVKPAEQEADLPLEIAHLLLIDIVGYSKVLVNEQIELLQQLNRIVRTRIPSARRKKKETYSGFPPATVWHCFSFTVRKNRPDVRSRSADS